MPIPVAYAIRQRPSANCECACRPWRRPCRRQLPWSGCRKSPQAQDQSPARRPSARPRPDLRRPWLRDAGDLLGTVQEVHARLLVSQVLSLEQHGPHADVLAHGRWDQLEEHVPKSGHRQSILSGPGLVLTLEFFLAREHDPYFGDALKLPTFHISKFESEVRCLRRKKLLNCI